MVGLKVCLGLYVGIQKTGWAMVMCSLNLFMKLGVLALVFWYTSSGFFATLEVVSVSIQKYYVRFHF